MTHDQLGSVQSNAGPSGASLSQASSNACWSQCHCVTKKVYALSGTSACTERAQVALSIICMFFFLFAGQAPSVVYGLRIASQDLPSYSGHAQLASLFPAGSLRHSHHQGSAAFL